MEISLKPLSRFRGPLLYDELLAAIPAAEVTSTQRLFHRRTNGSKDAVSKEMPIPVVQLFEMVEVDEQQRDWLLRPLSTPELGTY